MAVNQVSMNGEDLINLTADTVTEETLLENETAHDASGNIITGKFVPYNPNLIINPDFSINQRGQTEYIALNASGFIPCYDSWYYANLNVESASIKKDENNKVLVPPNSILEQRFECLLNHAQDYTLSISFGEETEVMTCKPSLIDVDYTVFQNGVKAKILATLIRIYNPLDHSIEVEWAKLELGKVATPFVRPNPATELVKCQWNYKELFGTYVLHAFTANTLYFNVPYGDMRITPSCYFKSETFNIPYGIAIVNNEAVTYPEFSFTLITHADSGSIEVRASKSDGSAHGLDRTNCLLSIYRGTPICVSAEP